MSTTTHTITFSQCGHTSRDKVTWHGGAAQRDSKIAWVGDNLSCPECRQSQRDQRDADRLAATETSDLTGSPKQIAWATDIRAKQAAKWEADATTLTRWNPAVAALVTDVAQRLLATTDATWWIDNRGGSLLSTITIAVRNTGARTDTEVSNLDADQLTATIKGA